MSLISMISGEERCLGNDDDDGGGGGGRRRSGVDEIFGLHVPLFCLRKPFLQRVFVADLCIVSAFDMGFRLHVPYVVLWNPRRQRVCFPFAFTAGVYSSSSLRRPVDEFIVSDGESTLEQYIV